MKYLGYMNGWQQTPLEFVAHLQAVKSGEDHPVEEIKLRNCQHEYRCAKCGIEWRVDSGD